MNLKLKALIAGAVMLAGSAVFAVPVSAAVPNLSVNFTGTSTYSGSNQVQVTTTNANPYSEVSLFYRQTNTYYTEVANLGETDVTGYLNTTTTITTDGSSNPLLFYVLAGGLQSNTVTLYPSSNGTGTNCYYVNGVYTCGSNVSISQTNVTMNLGQSLSLNVYGGSTSVYYSSPYFIASNSSSGVVEAGVSGSTLTLYAEGSGTSTVQVCPTGASTGSSTCANVYVTVSFNGTTSNGNVTLSQSSLALSTGQSSVVQVYVNNTTGTTYYGNAFTVNNNSNPGVVTTQLSGSSLTVYGSEPGNATLTICNQNGYASSNGCASLYVTVNSSGTSTCYYVNGVYTCPPSTTCYNNGYSTNCGNQSTLTFSTQNPSLAIGQTAAIVIYGNGYNNIYSYNNYQSYTVSGNSNASVVSAATSGNSLNITALSAGTSVVSVCSLYGNVIPVIGTSGTACGTVYVTVVGSTVTYVPPVTYVSPAVPQQPQQVLGASTYPNGTLVQQGSTIYIFYRNTLTAFGSYGAFAGLGFKLAKRRHHHVQQHSSLRLHHRHAVRSSPVGIMGQERSGHLLYQRVRADPSSRLRHVPQQRRQSCQRKGPCECVRLPGAATVANDERRREAEVGAQIGNRE